MVCRMAELTDCSMADSSDLQKAVLMAKKTAGSKADLMVMKMADQMADQMVTHLACWTAR